MRKSVVGMMMGLSLILSLLFGVTAFAAEKKASAPVEGVYSDFVSSSESGDVSGFRVVILNSGDNYFVIVQYAEGAIPEPVMAKATVKGKSIKFILPNEGRFEAMVTDKGLNFVESFSSAHRNKPRLVKRLLKL
jgi:hypothetical protein